MEILFDIIGALSSCGAIIFGLFALVFSLKHNKKEDTEDIQNRIARETKVDLKLDETIRNTSDIKNDISSLKAEMNKQSTDFLQLRADIDLRLNQISGRVDTLEEVIELIKTEVKGK